MEIVFMTSGTITSSISYRPLSLAKELVKKGHDVYVFAPRFDKYSQFKDEGIREIDGVKIVRPLQIKTFSFELGLIPYILSSAVLLHKINPDIIHMYKPNPITIVGLLPKFTRKASVVLDIDDLDSEVMRIEENSRLKIKLVELSQDAATRHADGISTASKYLQKQYQSLGITAYIPNGADFTDIEKIPVRALSKKNIVFIGNINRKNILEPLFHSVHELKSQKANMSVKIIGDGKYLPYFKNLSKKLGLSDTVTFLGYIPQNKLYKYVKPGDIGYCYMPNEPTIKACSSMKVFQYMQFGAVPLVSNVGDLPLYVYKGKAGYIAKSNNKNALTETMHTALIDKKENKKKIGFTIKHAKKNYQWAVLAEKNEQLYKTIL